MTTVEQVQPSESKDDDDEAPCLRLIRPMWRKGPGRSFLFKG